MRGTNMHLEILIAFVAGLMVGGSLGALIMAACVSGHRCYDGTEEV
jgi:hypothetical protein